MGSSAGTAGGRGGDDDGASRTWRSMVRVSGLMRRVSEPHFARYGLSPAQWGVLRSLARMEAGGHREPRMNELREHLLVQPPSLSATVDRMVRAGLVTRRTGRDDQRTRHIGLTNAGRSRLDAAHDDHRAWVHGMMAALTPEEQAHLGVLLERLGEHLSRILEESPGGSASSGAYGRSARATSRARRAS